MSTTKSATPRHSTRTGKWLGGKETRTMSIESITVIRTIGRYDIGDASAADADWQRTVSAACASEIETTLAADYPEASVDVDVRVGAESGLTVEIDGEWSSDLDEVVRDASQRGFDRACSG
jgi:hypothetical protein